MNRYLSAFQDRDIPELRRFLSPAWQLQRADGSRVTKSSFLRDVPTLRSYKMRRLRTTRAANVVVVTLQVDSDLVVDGKPYRTGYAPRLATFTRTANGWRMTSYANFNTPA